MSAQYSVEQAIRAATPLLYEAMLAGTKELEFNNVVGLTLLGRQLSTQYVAEQPIDMDTVWEVAGYPSQCDTGRLVCICGHSVALRSISSLRYHCPECSGKYQYVETTFLEATFADILHEFAQELTRDVTRKSYAAVDLKYKVNLAWIELVLAQYIWHKQQAASAG